MVPKSKNNEITSVDLYEMKLAFEYFLKDLYEKKILTYLKEASSLNDHYELACGLLGFKLRDIFNNDKRIKQIIDEEFNSFMNNKDSALKMVLFYKASLELKLKPSQTPTGKLMHLVSNFLKGYYDINNLTNKMNSFGLFKDIDNLIKNESSQLGKSEKNKLENQAYAICYGKSYRVFYFLRKQKFLRFLSLLFIIYFSTKFLGIYKGFFTSLLWVIVAYISTNYLITFIIFNKYKTSQ